jgi:hypothetical protein
MAMRGLRQAIGDGRGVEGRLWKEARMPEIARFKLRDWLVPLTVAPACLLLLVVIASFCQW